MEERDTLQTAMVAEALQTKWVGRAYHYLEQVGSTNDVLKKMLVIGTPDAGTVVLTDYQRQGRGRLERRWQAPPNSSLLMSILFRPQWALAQAQWITMMASVAAAEAIEAATSLSVALKWPNDVVVAVDGGWHKVSGLLIESEVGVNGRLSSVILGIGINVNILAESLPMAHTPATSLLVATGQPVPRLPLLVDFLKRLEHSYEMGVLGHSPQTAWNQRLITLGQRVTVSQVRGDDSFVGVAEGTDIWGHLLIRDETDTLHTIAAGDVTLRAR